MNETITILFEILLQSTSKSEVDYVVDELVKIGEPVIVPLLEFRRSVPISKHLRIFRVLREIGYPINKPALTAAITEITDINSPGWDYALAIIKESGESAVPEISNFIKSYILEPEDNFFMLQGIINLLEELDPNILYPIKSPLQEMLNIIPTNSPYNKWIDDIIGKINKVD